MKKLLVSLAILGLFLIVLSLSIASIWTSSLDEDIIAYWKFEEASGNVTDDLGRYNGTNINGTLTEKIGIVGYGYEFNSTIGTHINITQGINGFNNMTISAWVKPTRLVAFAGIVSHWNDGSWSMDMGVGGNRGRFRVYTTAPGSQSVEGTGNMVVDTWYHLVGVYNGTDVAMWKNGVLEDRQLLTGLEVVDDARNVTIGKMQIGAVNYYFNGTIDEIGIWNRSLSKSEIEDLYNTGIGLTRSAIDITLVSPKDNSVRFILSVVFNCSGTTGWGGMHNISLYHNDSGTFELNQTLDVSATEPASVSAAFSVDFGKEQKVTWNCRAANNDSEMYWADANSTLNLSVFTTINSVYNSSVLETSTQNYRTEINATESISSASATLWYNGTSYTSSVIDNTDGNYTAINNIDVPLSPYASANKNFWWEWAFIISGTSQKQNSTSYTQEVNRTYLTFCSSAINVSYVNFTTHYAVNPFPRVNASFKSSWSWFVEGGGSVARNYSYENISEVLSIFPFCMDNNKTTYKVSSTIEYENATSAKNFYYLANATLTNITTNISLYLLNGTSSTLTVLRVQDGSQVGIEAAYIQIQMYDVGTDTFYTIAMAKTNYDGEDLAYLNWYDTLYKFIGTKDETVLFSTSPYKVFETPRIFNIIGETTFEFDKFEGFSYDLYYNTTSQNFVLTFIKPSGDVLAGCLRVIKRNQTRDTIICNICETSASATLYCNIAAYGNGTYVASFYALGSFDVIDMLDVLIGVASLIYDELGNLNGTALAIIFAGIVMTFFLVSPVLGVIGVILGALGAIALGFQPMEYGTFIGLVLVGGFVIWLLKR